MPRVLIVDDSKVVAAMIKKKIESELQFQVSWVHSYMEALKLFKTEGVDFLVSLVGLYLPDAPSGEIVDYVISKNIPTIVFTSELSDEVREEIWSKKVVDYVFKEGGHNLDYIISVIKRIEKNKLINVLVVDDSDLFRRNICDLLTVHRYNVVDAKGGNEAIKILNENRDIKLVITDYNMPGMDGFELVKKIRGKYGKADISIIGMSGNNSLSAKFIKHGANDFLSKDFFTEEFYCRVTQNVEMIENIQELKEASNKDFLTNMYNRRYFFEIGDRLFENAMRKHISLVVTMMDIDYFKKVNDTYGHDVGDIVLKKIASIIKQRFRQSDIAARFGGEEFCIISCNMDIRNVKRIFDDLREKIEKTDIVIDERVINVTMSVGICCKLLDSLENMIKVADQMLYKAKETGRNRVILSAS